MRRPNRTNIEHLITDAHRLLNAIDPALSYIDESLAGWPTHPGTHTHSEMCPCGNITPCPNHPDTPNTSTEAAALNPDRARTNLDQLTRYTNQAATALRRAAAIATYWAHPGIDDSTVQRRLVAVDANVWCNNCLTSGHRNVRRPGAHHCDWCLDFQKDWHRLPTKEILDLRATKGRVYQQDIVRIHARTPTKKRTRTP